MPPPNIVLITAAGFRWDCAGFAGNPDVSTPNLDGLARHGVVFRQAICQLPLRRPSRATILTGQYPGVHGVRSIAGTLAQSARTLPWELKLAGYRTGAAGLMDFSPPRADYGFDELQLAETSAEGRARDDYHAWLWTQHPGTPEAVAGANAERHSSAWIGSQAVRFIHDAPEPFFLWASFIKPHHPYEPPEPWDTMYEPDALQVTAGYSHPIPEGDLPDTNFYDFAGLDEAGFRTILASYYGCISHVDSQIGRILAAVHGRGHTNNVFLFCSDHGDYMGQHGLILKSGRKPYDAILRVPFVVSGVADQRRGALDDAPVELVDVMPTLLDAAGVPAPPTVQGASLLPRLRDAEAPMRDAAYAEYGAEQRIIRTRAYKLVEPRNHGERLLFDLYADPGEFANLAGKPAHARIQAELTRMLRKRLHAAGG